MKYQPPGVGNRSRIYVPRTAADRAKPAFPALSAKSPVERNLGAWGATIDKDKLRDLKNVPTKLLNIQKIDSSASLENEEGGITQARISSGSNLDDDPNYDGDYDDTPMPPYIQEEDESLMQDVAAFANALR